MPRWCSNTSSASVARRPSCSRPSASREACSTRHCRRPDEWVAAPERLVGVVKLRETEEDRRLRHAACLLSDIGWRVHPDHRGEETLSLITNGNFGSISHQGRAFVALSVFY